MSTEDNNKKDELLEKKNEFLRKLEQDGVVNPRGFALASVGAAFLAAVPLTSWLAQENGIVEKSVNGLCKSIALLGSAGSTRNVSQRGKVAALSTLYLVMAYAITGANSAAASAAGLKGGRDESHPRAQVQSLRGLPLRLYSAHNSLLEQFPAFALAAALAQTMAPGEQSLVNLLGLAVIAKVLVQYPAYVMNVIPLRQLAHVIGTACVINVALKLSKTP